MGGTSPFGKEFIYNGTNGPAIPVVPSRYDAMPASFAPAIMMSESMKEVANRPNGSDTSMLSRYGDMVLGALLERANGTNWDNLSGPNGSTCGWGAYLVFSTSLASPSDENTTAAMLLR